MKKTGLWLLYCLLISQIALSQQKSALFPDGTAIPSWFRDTSKLDINKLGRLYDITQYGVKRDSDLLQTAAIQKVIDLASSNGGGIISIPAGTFLSGALFFKPQTRLHLQEGAKLKGSDDIKNYPLMASRMEGQNLDYFPALVNAYGVNNFSITGHGTIDGNGLKYWEAFWQRRKENPECTNLEVSRPRLVFIWNCENVQLQDVRLHNSGFWTSHYYQCKNVKMLDLHIYSPYQPVKAPSTDAIDLDVCSNVLIRGCYLSVNDDAIALKGGKGPWADQDKNNGENTNILIEDCEFGFCHSALTCGSEAIHNKNIVMRNCHIEQAQRVLWLKMRPDTPQKYEFIAVENVSGNAKSLIYVKPWTQFFDLKGRKDVPLSYSENITLKDINMKVTRFFDVAITEYDRLKNFTFVNLDIQTENPEVNKSVVDHFVLKNVKVNGKIID